MWTSRVLGAVTIPLLKGAQAGVAVVDELRERMMTLVADIISSLGRASL